MLNFNLEKTTKKASTRAMINTFFASDLATLFMFSKIKFNNYHLNTK